jgi:uncharacterized phage protein (TIGR01671 family)
MNREIEFCGKSIIDKKWIYGFLSYSDNEDVYYIGVQELMTPVITESVGQYTGLKDKNGKKIFEGDLISSPNWNPSTYKVMFQDGEFCFVSLNEREKPYTNSIHYASKDFEVIGNIHDNPELLKS